jgi:hypothetical protein
VNLGSGRHRLAHLPVEFSPELGGAAGAGELVVDIPRKASGD